MGKTSKDKRDIYYRLAKTEGFRARSAFKLMQIDENFNIFKGVTRAVDLCAAPGSWSQVLSKKLYLTEKNAHKRDLVKIVAIDLQPMSPLPGVIQIQGDITEMKTALEIISHFGGEMAQLVVCDGAPDVTGLHAFDEYLQNQLVFSAFNITSFILARGGIFISKIFRAKNINLLYAQMKHFFKDVHCCKPKSSRQSSCEAFIVCKDYQPPEGYEPSLVNPVMVENYEECINSFPGTTNQSLVPFIACGDLSGFDSDRTYPFELSELSAEFKDWKYDQMDVIQAPTEPAYKKAASLKKNQKLEKEIMDGRKMDLEQKFKAQTSNGRSKVKENRRGKEEAIESDIFDSNDNCLLFSQQIWSE